MLHQSESVRVLLLSLTKHRSTSSLQGKLMCLELLDYCLLALLALPAANHRLCPAMSDAYLGSSGGFLHIWQMHDV